MQPRPMAETLRPLRPNSRICICSPFLSFDIVDAQKPASPAVRVVERPDIVGERQNLRRVELGSAHRRHGAGMVLRLGTPLVIVAVIDEAAVAPQPFAGGQIWARPACRCRRCRGNRRTSPATSPENTCSPRSPAPRLPGGGAASARGAGIGMNALWRARRRSRRSCRCSSGAGAASMPVVGSPS